VTWGDSRCATADALSRSLACSAYLAVQSNGRKFDRRSFPHHSGSPRVRILVAPLESVNPGGDDEKANWQNTDKHSRTERLRGCCLRRARRWKTLRVRLA